MPLDALHPPTHLPPGVHPNDPAVYVTGQGQHIDANPAVPADTPGVDYKTGVRPYLADNYEAVAVFERGSDQFAVKVIVVDANNGGTAIACGRQKGRKSVTLTVPTILPNGTVPSGVLFASTEDEVQAGVNSAGILNLGDSVTIYTEAAVWVGLIPGNTGGAVQVLTESNPAGGGLMR